MADPVAVITITGTSEINYGDLTPTPPSRVLSGTTSTAGSGSSITDYQWYLLSSPTGSAATFNDDTLASPTLGPLDKAGTYRVFLVVTNDLSDTSHAAPVPTQSLSSPYAFTVPPASAFFEIRVLTEFAALKKVAYGERDWLEDGLWPIVDAVDAHEGKLDDIWVSAGVIKANTINEYTAGNGVTVDGVLLKDGDVKVATSSDAVYTNIIVAGSVGGGSTGLLLSGTPVTVSGNLGVNGAITANTINEYTPNSGVTIDGVLVKDGDVKVATSTDKVFTNVIEAGSVAGGSTNLGVTATTATFSDDVYITDTLRADTIQSFTNNVNPVIRGRGSATADLDVDVIQADSGNSGVTIVGKGTHSYDLQASVIKTDSITSDSVGALAIGNSVGAVQFSAVGAMTFTAGSAIHIDGLETNFGSSATRNSVPVTLASWYPNQATTGTSAETLWSTNIPANTLNSNGASITGEIIFAIASGTSGHNKNPIVKFNGTTIVTGTSTVNGGWVKVTFTIMRTASNAHIGFGNTFDSISTHGSSGIVSVTATDTSAIVLAVQGETPSGAGDMTLKTVILHYNRAEAAL